MKRIAFLFKLCVACILTLSLSVSASASSSADVFANVDLGAGNSIQLIFAQLQMELAETTKKSAQQQMGQIAVQQEQQKAVNDAIERLNALREEKAQTLPADLAADIAMLLPEHANTVNAPMTDEQYGILQDALMQLQEQIGVEIQGDMVVLQDFMGQYNSYLQGANTAMESSTQTLRGITYGGTMLSDGLGMNITFALGGIIVGAVVTLLITRKKQGKESK